jgi:hypothetical protein
MNEPQQLKPLSGKLLTSLIEGFKYFRTRHLCCLSNHKREHSAAVLGGQAGIRTPRADVEVIRGKSALPIFEVVTLFDTAGVFPVAWDEVELLGLAHDLLF